MRQQRDVLKIPDPPEGTIEFDFRMTPTRITAVEMYVGGYTLYEIDRRSGQKKLLLQSRDWTEIYREGRRRAEL